MKLAIRQEALGDAQHADTQDDKGSGICENGLDIGQEQNPESQLYKRVNIAPAELAPRPEVVAAERHGESGHVEELEKRKNGEEASHKMPHPAHPIEADGGKLHQQSNAEDLAKNQ